LTTRRTDANLLMQALAQEAAAEIEQRLIQQSSEREQALLREFLAANRRTANAVLALSDDLVMANDLADRSLDGADLRILREKAADLIAGHHDSSAYIVLSGGQLARLRCHSLASPAGTAGTIVEVTLGETAPRRHTPISMPAEPLPGLAGQSAAWLESANHVETLCRRGSWVLLLREPCLGHTGPGSWGPCTRTPTWKADSGRSSGTSPNRCRCRPSGTGSTTSVSWSRISSSATPPAGGSPSPRTPCTPCFAVPGPATSRSSSRPCAAHSLAGTPARSPSPTSRSPAMPPAAGSCPSGRPSSATRSSGRSGRPTATRSRRLP